MLVGIGARDVADQIRFELPQSRTESVIQPGQVIAIADAVGQIDVNRGRRLPQWIVVVLVQRNGEHIPGIGAFSGGSTVEAEDDGNSALAVRVPAKIAAVPLPWCTSQSTVIAVRMASSRCNRRIATATS